MATDRHHPTHTRADAATYFDGQRQQRLPVEAQPDRAEGDREPPRDTGKRFATLARPGRHGKPDTEVRVTLDTFEGNGFAKLHGWQRGTDGLMYPTRRLITIRRGEILDTIKALCAIAREMGVELHPAKDGGEKGGDDVR